MGCASSAPGAIVERSKKLANTVAETANDTVHNATESVTTGVDNVQNSVRIALKGAEETVENAVAKIGETFNLTSNSAEENGNTVIKKEKEDVLNNFADNLNHEATSETETIPASDVEHVKEAFANKSAAFFETVHSVEDEIDETMNDLEEMNHESSEIIAKSREKFEEMRKSVEDLTDGFKEEANSSIQNGLNNLDDFQTESEQVFDETRKNFEDLNLGESVKKIKKEIEELHSFDHGGGTDGKRAEEFHPTFWEQAADAILLRKAIKHLEQPIQELIFFTPPVHRTDDFRNGHTTRQNSNDLDVHGHFGK